MVLKKNRLAGTVREMAGFLAFNILLVSGLSKADMQQVLKRCPDAVPPAGLLVFAGHTPLHLVGCQLHCSVLRNRARNGGPENGLDDVELPFHFSDEDELLEKTKWILSLNADAVRQKDHLGRLPLHNVCDSNAQLTVVKLLLEAYPAAVRSVDSRGDTLLSLALHPGNSVYNDHFAVLHFLMDNSAWEDMQLRNKAGLSLLDRVIIVSQNPYAGCPLERRQIFSPMTLSRIVQAAPQYLTNIIHNLDAFLCLHVTVDEHFSRAIFDDGSCNSVKWLISRYRNIFEVCCSALTTLEDDKQALEACMELCKHNDLGLRSLVLKARDINANCAHKQNIITQLCKMSEFVRSQHKLLEHAYLPHKNLRSEQVKLNSEDLLRALSNANKKKPRASRRRCHQGTGPEPAAAGGPLHSALALHSVCVLAVPESDDPSDTGLLSSSSNASIEVCRPSCPPSRSPTPEYTPVQDHSAGIDPVEPAAPPNLVARVRSLEAKLSQERCKWAHMMAMKRFSETDVPQSMRNRTSACSASPL